MKKDLKELAIDLRLSGKSINKIAAAVGVAKSTVSLWVKDVPLSAIQRTKLKENSNNLDTARLERNIQYSKECREKRLLYQEHGKLLAQKNDPGFAAGCMLYWGEGGKTIRNKVQLTNSDPNILIYFVSFLNKYYGVDNSKISGCINCHLDYGINYEEIEQHWKDLLGIAKFYKPQIHQGQPQTKGKHAKLKYGTCSITLGDVKVIQSIFGGIQEIAKISKPEWLG